MHVIIDHRTIAISGLASDKNACGNNIGENTQRGSGVDRQGAGTTADAIEVIIADPECGG